MCFSLMVRVETIRLHHGQRTTSKRNRPSGLGKPLRKDIRLAFVKCLRACLLAVAASLLVRAFYSAFFVLPDSTISKCLAEVWQREAGQTALSFLRSAGCSQPNNQPNKQTNNQTNNQTHKHPSKQARGKDDFNARARKESERKVKGRFA